ncbi:uncharacterized protein DUF938 [Chromohalobacter marismortui]|uniref:Uncharacterized protein DUF938 n=1 Tax=Chromohalobacter marismortui TaxID=42055 RepID=A0A4R7NUK0_9GAMM|nr:MULTISPECIES: DUF938 domain-containing protein [Chromohalobacter]MCI0510794.1 class I SAM-dependent methyltransferase [Chromohalobacter sp.]MCI0594797.1 class I SAM-dependent methyltransferase [Chromohalobacter sp.]TDU24628.1 uncharacterized protein DUF938 [Chromohalobacter marismortui]
MQTMETSDPGEGVRLSTPAAKRNREPILALLREVLPATGRVLEIASGSGEHAVYFAQHLPALIWQPSDPSAQARRSIDAWRRHAALTNIASPLALDVTQPWPDEAGEPSAMLCINMLHISPWAATRALLREAGRRLPVGGVLVVYGPFMRDGEHTAASNAAFDADLRQRDPAWGIRELDDVDAEARQHELVLQRVEALPANNLGVVFRRAANA